jgi:hypothetical protein
MGTCWPRPRPTRMAGCKPSGYLPLGRIRAARRRCSGPAPVASLRIRAATVRPRTSRSHNWQRLPKLRARGLRRHGNQESARGTLDESAARATPCYDPSAPGALRRGLGTAIGLLAVLIEPGRSPAERWSSVARCGAGSGLGGGGRSGRPGSLASSTRRVAGRAQARARPVVARGRTAPRIAGGGPLALDHGGRRAQLRRSDMGGVARPAGWAAGTGDPLPRAALARLADARDYRADLRSPSGLTLPAARFRLET